GGVTPTLDPTGSILTIDLDPPLGDQDCYAIGLAGMTSTEGGDILNPTFTVRTLVGDVNRTGRVNATDKNLIKGKIGTPLSADDFLFDVNLSGRINATDKNLVKGWIGHTVAECP
ncbi:MAG: hypothetical protein GY778_00885, partial [bacterium]|nr:hypothetical protein [bacterium]